MTIPTIQLNNGHTIPQLGLGVYQTKEGDEVQTAVTAALKSGYTLIDTAAIYGNEAGVGRALAEATQARGDLFITTKLWNAEQGYDSALIAFDESLARLRLDYVDLYLIHWPVPKESKFVSSWKALEKIYADGRAKSIGVSNFKPHHLQELLDQTEIIPAVNQIELHPRFTQKETRDFCALHNIKVESWSPIGGSGGDLLTDPVLAQIGQQYHKSPAQVVLRWHIQQDLIVIPKSSRPERIAENTNIFAGPRGHAPRAGGETAGWSFPRQFGRF